jgi:hypothetical protein
MMSSSVVRGISVGKWRHYGASQPTIHNLSLNKLNIPVLKTTSLNSRCHQNQYSVTTAVNNNNS